MYRKRSKQSPSLQDDSGGVDADDDVVYHRSVYQLARVSVMSLFFVAFARAVALIARASLIFARCKARPMKNMVGKRPRAIGTLPEKNGLDWNWSGWLMPARGCHR